MTDERDDGKASTGFRALAESAAQLERETAAKNAGATAAQEAAVRKSKAQFAKAGRIADKLNNSVQ